jgi:acetyl esterase/lipase
MSETAVWISDAVEILKLREQQAQRRAMDFPAMMAKTVSLPDGPALSADALRKLDSVPQGSGRPRTPWGKSLARTAFGSSAERKGLLKQAAAATNGSEADGEAKRLSASEKKAADLQRGIDEQIAAGTAAAVSIPSADGRQLLGNFFSARGHNLREAPNNAPNTDKPVVLFLSGSHGTAEEFGTEIAETYQEMEASTLAVNFGGFGDSTGGLPSEKSLLEDGQAMLKYLRQLGYAEDKIILHGFSMGGAIAGMLAAHNEKQGMKLRGLMLDRPMVSVTHGVQAHVGDAVEETTEKWAKPLKAMGSAVGSGGIKIGSLLTRASVGKMSARKALTATEEGRDPTTRIVVSGDKGRFAAQGEALRNQLKGKAASQDLVAGTASGAEHLDTEEMIDKNRAFMRALVDTTPETGLPAIGSDPRPVEQEIQATRKIRARIMQKFDEANEWTVTWEVHFNLAGTALAKGGTYFNNVQRATLGGQLEKYRNDLTELARSIPDAFERDIRQESAKLLEKFDRFSSILNDEAEAAGVEAPTIAIKITQAKEAIQNYAGLRTEPDRDTLIHFYRTLTGYRVFFSEKESSGFAFSTDDAICIANVRRVIGIIDAALSSPAPTPPPPAPPPPVRIGPAAKKAILQRQRSRARLTESLS